ncbi:hypothetical protein DY000_02022181 [Brassica cretica]|uniref:Uncharacterized protein n=1 Tax=Brassica cretica TaxID=69181 RepID=A0ABQ7EFP7_BRACR|nr:hypothetical protein DY000_02022181 [Brassica cretica]
MEDMDFGRASIDDIAKTSSDESTEISVDTAHQTSIDDTPPEAGKFSLTYNTNEGVVLGEPKGQLSNANNQIINEQGTAIPVQINSISKRDHEWKLPLQDYLNPGRTYSNRGRAKSRLNQAFTGNRKLASDLNGKIDIMYSELMRKFDALSEHIKRLDGQVTENATTIKREAGRLPGRTDANPKCQVNAVLIPSMIEIDNAEKRAVVEETGENRSRPIILDDPNTESETPREKELPNTEEAAIDLEEEEEELEEDVEIDRQERTNVDRHATVNIDRHPGNNVDRRSTSAEPAMERVYRTLPPFSPNKTQTKRELDKAICNKAFDKIMLEMPLILTSSEEETFSVDSRAEE